MEKDVISGRDLASNVIETVVSKENQKINQHPKINKFKKSTEIIVFFLNLLKENLHQSFSITAQKHLVSVYLR